MWLTGNRNTVTINLHNEDKSKSREGELERGLLGWGVCHPPAPNLHARNKHKCGQVGVAFKGGTLPSEEIVLTGCNFLERVIKVPAPLSHQVVTAFAYRTFLFCFSTKLRQSETLTRTITQCYLNHQL